jgi:hypothetical protein
MTEQELRALVREAIARHAAPTGGLSTDPSRVAGPSLASVRLHSSHAIFPVTAGAEGDGACIIEPAVPCNHCGYCKSLGH